MTARRPTRNAPWPRDLLHWYRANARTLPWRTAGTPYRVWVSEIMLQQTQVKTVLPFYRRFLRRFPSLKQLALAPLDDILKQWEGLGYYHRARNLHATAQRLHAERHGRFPRTAHDLQALPGIGAYTAAAVASICFGEPAPVIDGNVTRVFARFLAIREPADQPLVRRRIHAFLADHILHAWPGDFNQAMMELGALVCRPGLPDCERCPLASDCLALQHGLVMSIPVSAKKKRPPHEHRAACLLERNGKVLAVKRPVSGLLGGLWDLPGTTAREEERIEDAAQRVVAELGRPITTPVLFGTVKHAFSHFTMTLHGLHSRIESDKRSTADRRWVTHEALLALPLPAATRRLLVAAGLPEKTFQA